MTFEIDRPGNGVSFSAWFDGNIDRVRVVSSPGGIALTRDETRALIRHLEAMLDD